ncbi:MAG: hypothetical protein P8Z79_21085 [Sedimentisphaerales bacterium]|jgi:hypothetical protein
MESTENLSSEEELLKLKNEGRITEEEYQDLLSAMRKSPSESHPVAGNNNVPSSLQRVPWQIWVVVVVLVLEGINNLFLIPQNPYAITWLAAKTVFIVGLIKGWKWVFFLNVIVGGIHVLYFLIPAPLVALINLVLVVLVISSYRFYFSQNVITSKEYDNVYHSHNRVY